VRLRDFCFLTDENIHPAVVTELRVLGCDVLDVREGGLIGSDDLALLKLAKSTNQVAITHDKDFGALSIASSEPIVGILFLRPGHIDPRFTMETLRSLFAADPTLTPPFIVVAKRTGGAVTIRVRNL
jgi:predicted nuclease of predicted toxin-antitoxin system